MIPDLAADERFQRRPYIHARPFNRQYIGVPIRTPGPCGINIGVLCVFSTQVRLVELDQDSVAFMRDMSRTIMGYLECRVAQRRFCRSERMTRGMGNFVEGLDSLTSLAGAANRSTTHSKRSSRMADPAVDGIKELEDANGTSKRPLGLLPKAALSDIRVIGDTLLSPRTPTPPPSLDDTTSSARTNPSLEPVVAVGTSGPGSLTTMAPDDSSRCSTPRPASQQSRDSGVQPAVLSEVSTADLQLAQSVRVFAKAANIIRQSLEIDGVLFLDATVRSFGGLVGQQSERKISTVGIESMNYLSNDEDSTNQIPSAVNKEDCCNVLGFSTPEASSIHGDSVPWRFGGLRDRTLQRLLRRYPQGQIFSYEADGSVLQTPLPMDGEPLTPGLPLPKRPASPLRQWSQDSQGTTDDFGEAPTRQQSLPTIQKQRWNAAESVAHLFPGARSVIIVPLWDSQKKRWAAGGFVWTNSPTRVFSVDGALAFLRVFGLIVMAEIYRLNTKFEENMKSNILGSISHELRSPLHGLVGAVECK